MYSEFIPLVAFRAHLDSYQIVIGDIIDIIDGYHR